MFGLVWLSRNKILRCCFETFANVAALVWLRGSHEVKEEMEQMRAENDMVKSLPKVTIKEMLVNPSLKLPLVIAAVIMIAQQFSGINAVSPHISRLSF